MRQAIAALLLTTLTGCGLTMTRGPDPRRPADQRPVCTESFAAPQQDSIGAVLGLATILTGVLFLKYSDSNDEVGAPLIIAGAVVTAASYGSGAIGYARVKKCRKAIAGFERGTP
jgi:hypothetical protein